LFAALIVEGDLFQDRHPDEPARTFVQRAFGCSGFARWRTMIDAQDKPIEDVLREFNFDSETGTTPCSVAAMSVFASALSYVKAAEIEKNGAFNTFFPKATVIDKEPYQAVVIGNDRVVIAAFRGTDNAKNWVANFRPDPATTDLGRVHAGFMAGYQALSAEVTRAVVALRDKEQSVWLTGHSLGGAMAMLAAPELQTTIGRVESVVTFGQPPAGYSGFAEAWEKMFPERLVRYVNHRDAVANVMGFFALPWTSLTHTGQRRYFDTSGKLHVNDVPPLQMMRDAVCAPCMESGAEFHAHYVRRYITLISSMPKQ
jgi:hypothetical protein